MGFVKISPCVNENLCVHWRFNTIKVAMPSEFSFGTWTLLSLFWGRDCLTASRAVGYLIRDAATSEEQNAGRLRWMPFSVAHDCEQVHAIRLVFFADARLRRWTFRLSVSAQSNLCEIDSVRRWTSFANWTAALDACWRPLPTQIFVRFQVISSREPPGPARPVGRLPPPPGLLRITPSRAAADAASGTSRSAFADCCRLQWRLLPARGRSPPVRTANSNLASCLDSSRRPSAGRWRAAARYDISGLVVAIAVRRRRLVTLAASAGREHVWTENGRIGVGDRNATWCRRRRQPPADTAATAETEEPTVLEQRRARTMRRRRPMSARRTPRVGWESRQVSDASDDIRRRTSSAILMPDGRTFGVRKLTNFASRCFVRRKDFCKFAEDCFWRRESLPQSLQLRHQTYN